MRKRSQPHDLASIEPPRRAASRGVWAGYLTVFALSLGAGLVTTGCEDDQTPIFVARCQSDDECPNGQICLDGACVPRDRVSCQEIEGGQAILQPGPSLVDFGYVGSGTSRQELALRNIGDCTLTVFEAYFELEDGSAFECPKCAPENFPLELFPFRDEAVTVFFTPDGVGDYADELILLSDDAEYSRIRIPIRARFNGIPKLAVAPDEVDFDYAPVGRTVNRQIQLTNQGTGIAPLVIERIEIETSTEGSFEFEPEIVDLVSIDPVSVDPQAGLTLNLRYRPQEIENHAADLVIYTNMPTDSVVRIPLQGSSQTPAKISVAPESINFGPVPLGQTTNIPLTIVNEGGTPLRVTYRWGGTGLSTDLSALPQIVPPIPPGQYTEMQVLVTATAPREITGLLLIESNDPTRPSVTVPVSAQGQDVVGAQVIKIDMNYENGSDSVFDDDFRNVDLTLENPFGLVVNKQNAQPTNWMSFGNPSWLAFGPKEEPERVVLPDAQQDGTFRILLNYIEDCSSVPSGLVAAILGISVDALIAYFTGVPTGGVTGGAVSDAIESLCFNRSSSAVTTTIYINGQVVAEVPTTLGRKGDYVYAADLVRQGGEWSVRY